MKPYHHNLQSLSTTEARALFEECSFGHLACHHQKELYLVPISYLYVDNTIYSHSAPGRKIDLMRKNPEVCVQVEKIEDFYHWKSAIAWGTFEELRDDEASRAMRMLIMKMNQAVELGSSLALDMTAQIESAIIYKINVKSITGRFEI
ncbi:MAG TPA: pyridoxamine 5'-phosphate oxidase family protein [Bdellovibrio sp.]|uniref:pyridoxamine 5'-phosphate oxidase family protein n=1 Tax=Bdellovibrio sp. TaxID=28201 RepID=UPI002F251778